MAVSPAVDEGVVDCNPPFEKCFTTSKDFAFRLIPTCPTCVLGCYRAWVKGVVGKSPSFDRAYASVGLQYLPLIMPGTWRCSGFAAGYLRSEDDWAFSLGPGFYWNPTGNRLLFGGSIFYDARMLIGRYYSQVGLSFEAYYREWRAVINSYIPGSDRFRRDEPIVYTGFPGDLVVTAQFQELSMPVVEGLIGRCFQPHPGTWLDLQLGLYTLSPFENMTLVGLIARARVEQIGPFFIEVQLTRDSWFDSRGQVAVGLQTKWRKKRCRPSGCSDLCRCAYRPRPLQRKEWIVLDGCCQYTVTPP